MPVDPLDILRTTFGHDSFRFMQEQVIAHVLAGQDALLLMPTGGGKSLCFQIPAMIRPGLGVIISPLIALMQDQVGRLQQLNVKAAYLNSTMTHSEAWDVKRKMMGGELDMLYVSPERLVTEGFLKALDQLQLALFAIDEAHCVSQWGHNFRPEYLQLQFLRERYPGVPRLALTATADLHTRGEIVARLGLPEQHIFAGGFDRPNIRYVVTPKIDWRRQIVAFLKGQEPGVSGIIYRMTRKSVDQTAEYLQGLGHNAIPYHAGMEDEVRRVNQQRFLDEPGAIVVATIAFGMGIDKSDVRFVVHLDLPQSLEEYHQQTGRAGRDGLPATAWLTYGVGDLVLMRKLIERSEAGEEFKAVEKRKLQVMGRFCETAECRRRLLLRYLGENLPEACGNCDTCLGEGPLELGPAEPRQRVQRLAKKRKTVEKTPTDPLAKPDKQLFERLREARLRLAQEQEVPAFMVFSDATLRDMAVRQPRTLEDFLAVKGVGGMKAERYWETFLRVIEECVE